MSEFCTGCGKAFAAADDRFCAGCGRERPAATSAVDTTTSSGAPPNKNSAIALVGVFAMIGVVPLFFLGSSLSCKGDTEGNVVVSEGPNPGFTFTPDGCASMQPYGRYGVNIHGVGPNDGAVYVTRDPITGGAVEVEIPGSCRNADGTECTVFPLPRAQCTTFEVALDYTGVTVNDVRQMKGHVAIDCTLADQTKVRGRIVFDGC